MSALSKQLAVPLTERLEAWFVQFPLDVPDIPDVRLPACAPEHELLFQRHRGRFGVA